MHGAMCGPSPDVASSLPFPGEAMENGPSPDSAVLRVLGGKGVVEQQQRPGAAGQGEALR